MSAFRCSPVHIGEIAKAYFDPALTVNRYNLITHKELQETPREIARELARANIVSLKARYPENYNDFFFEDYDPFTYMLKCEQATQGSRKVSFKDLYGMISCYTYQSCESSYWIEQDAYWIANHIQKSIAQKLIDPQMWEFTDEKITY